MVLTIVLLRILYCLSAGTPPLGSSTGMTMFNLPPFNLAFDLTLSVQPRCGQPAFEVTRFFRRGIYHMASTGCYSRTVSALQLYFVADFFLFGEHQIIMVHLR